jgi:hypothetical protein
MPRMDAPAGLLPLSRPLMTGEVLDAAFRLFRAGLARCLPYSGLAVLVIEFPTFYSTFFTTRLSVPGAFVQLGVVVVALTLLLGLISLRLHSIARGGRPSFRRELPVALARWPLAIVPTTAAIGLPAMLLAVSSALDFGSPIVVTLVFLLPVLVPTALFVLALPAYWCVPLGPFAAIGRAVSLARRRWWRMLGALLAASCMLSAFYVLSAIVVGMLSPLLGSADLFLIAAVQSLLSLVIGAFGAPFLVAVLIVAHEDLACREAQRRGKAA